jgi:xylan 1,4-beta-xylosidase
MKRTFTSEEGFTLLSTDTYKKNLLIAQLILLLSFILPVEEGIAQSLPAAKPKTICNPLNLNYRFCLDKPSRREAADPTIITFKNAYYLFASKSGGYWRSADLMRWDFITSADLPVEDYAPTAVVVEDTVYFMASTGQQGTKIYKSADPASGKWTVANDAFPISMTDPDLFLDDDGRLYFYYGCSNVNPIYAVELDRKTLMPVGQPVACFNSNRKELGWERTGDYNEKENAPWIEGAWMTKYDGKYYLQYAAPGTEFKSYSDGLYISDKPLGPFQLAVNNPFSYKPEGFIAGAGHSSTFMDKYGNYWHIATMTISVKHMFERRLGLFPAFFKSGGDAYTYTGFGDLPFTIPQKKISSPAELSTNWMLLSYAKPVEVSSALKEFPGHLAADENVRTYWSAETGNSNEWISIDLQKECLVNAVQLNFAEQGTELFGRSGNTACRYKLEYSSDKTNWKMLADKSLNKEDAPHDYMELTTPVKARYLRVMNVQMPGSGTFALSGFRVFGNAGGSLPEKVTTLSAVRAPADPCIVNLKWNKSKNATGYNIRYGSSPDKLYQNYQVLGSESLEIRSLGKDRSYYFAIDSFNESGVQKGVKTIFLK